MSSAVLAADLARHPRGDAVADVLDRALRMGPDDLARIGAGHRDDATRRRCWALVAAIAGLRSPVPATAAGTGAASGSAVAAGPAVAPAAEPAARDGLEAVLDCLREEIFGWTRRRADDLAIQDHPAGLAAVCDAVGAAYTASELPGRMADRLLEPWRAAYGELPAVPPADGFGPCSARVRAALDVLATAGAGRLARLHERHQAAAPGQQPADPPPDAQQPWGQPGREPAVPRPRDWARTMHGACQAAFLHGRVREVASAQFGVVRAVLIAGLPPEVSRAGVLTAATGAVQAVALADVLHPGAYLRLTAAWTETFGPP